MWVRAMKKSCFVIMGYGTKKNINLDLTYNEIIRPCIIKNGLVPYHLFEDEKYNAYRCDEISGTAAIDYKFVTCLSEADIVIADISTMNVNAIYELGARHALKPRSTILLCAKEDEQRFNFFDLTYVPIIFYKHGGAHIDIDAIRNTQAALDGLLDYAINSTSLLPDNPIQRALHERNLYPPIPSPEQQSLYKLYSEGRRLLDNNAYAEALQILSELYERDASEENMLLLVLAQYKLAEASNSCKSLIECVNFIKEKVDIESSTSERLLGRVAAIYLRLFNLLGEDTYYYLALDYYRLGAQYSKLNFYCPRNYCALLLRIHEISDDPHVLREYYYTAKHYAKLYIHRPAIASKSGSYEERVYCFYNACDMKAIIAGEYSNYEKLQMRLSTDDGISARQRNTIKVGMERILGDITEMNKRTKLF